MYGIASSCSESKLRPAQPDSRSTSLVALPTAGKLSGKALPPDNAPMAQQGEKLSLRHAHVPDLDGLVNRASGYEAIVVLAPVCSITENQHAKEARVARHSYQKVSANIAHAVAPHACPPQTEAATLLLSAYLR